MLDWVFSIVLSFEIGGEFRLEWGVNGLMNKKINQMMVSMDQTESVHKMWPAPDSMPFATPLHPAHCIIGP